LNIKLKKYLSNAGYCSRRKADQFIQDNSIQINSNEASHDSILQHGDVITINMKKSVEIKNQDRDIDLS
jgi:16S rRNA uridine-516 pseudouridylate synthase and related pseudouridylate synthases